MAGTKQASAFHETLPDSAPSVATVARVYWVLDPAGTGRYMAATSPHDGLGPDPAWFVEDAFGRLHLNTDGTGASRSAILPAAGVVLI